MIKQIVEIEPEKRTTAEIKQVINELKLMAYFKSFAEKKSQKLLNNVIEGFARQSLIEQFEQGQPILKFGERPDRFIILLEGEALNLVPKSADKLEEERATFQVKYPHIDVSWNYNFMCMTAGDEIQVRQIKRRSSTGNRSKSRVMKQDSRNSVDFNQNTRTRLDQSPSLREQKEEPLTQDHLDSLSKEVQAFKWVVYEPLTTLSWLFDGALLKYEVGKYFTVGECLTSELQRVDQTRKKRDTTLMALTACSVIYISLRQFDDLMKSIEKARLTKTCDMLMKAFDEGVRSTDLKIIMKELVRHASSMKMCSGQLLYQQGQPCQTLYVVKSGEFEVSKEFIYDKSYLPSFIDEPKAGVSLHREFLKALQAERRNQLAVKEQSQRQERVRKRSKTQELEPHDPHEQDRRLLEEVGGANYHLMQKLHKMRIRDIHENRRVKILQRTEYTLSRAGQGHLLGEEDFSAHMAGGVHRFHCRCVSSEGKIIIIRRSDIFRLCNVYDWFARMFFDRIQKKLEWLNQRFQDRLGRELAEQHLELDPVQQHLLVKAEMEAMKSQDQRILDKYSQISKSNQHRDHDVGQAVKKKLQIKKHKDQFLPKEEPLNVLEISADVDARKYEKNLQITLDRKGLGNSGSKASLDKPQLPREATQSFLRGSTPLKGDRDAKLQHDRSSRSMKQLAAEMIKKSIERTVNQQLKHPVKTYKSNLLNEHCMIYEDRNVKATQTPAVHDNDIGIIGYLVQTDKTQLRLQHYVLNKHNRNRCVSMSPVKHPSDVEPVGPYAPAQFCQFSTLLHHVTRQHYTKVMEQQQEQENHEQLPVSVRQLISQRNPSTQSGTERLRSTSSSLKNISQGRFSVGTLNRVRIRQKQSCRVSSNISQNQSRLASVHNQARDFMPQLEKFSLKPPPPTNYLAENQSFLEEQKEIIKALDKV